MNFQTSEQQWHQGELAMHRLMSAPTVPNPNTPFLSPSAAIRLASSPIQAVGMLDHNERPWTSIWAGEKGFSVPAKMQRDGHITSGIVIACVVDNIYDPVVSLIRDDQANSRQSSLSGLAIDLMERKRVKWAGTLVGASFKDVEADNDERSHTSLMQMAVEVTSSLGNCPKYINKIPILLTLPSPILHSSSSDSSLGSFPSEALSLIECASLFFLTTSHAGKTLSTNHRGGAPGFLRFLLPSQLAEGALFPISTQNPILAYPEFSGNRLYQSLGNLHETPHLGLAIPDFRTGNIFYATCYAKILAGTDATRVMPRSTLVVVMELLEWRLVLKGLSATISESTAAHWEEEVGWSPYNPPLRYLAAEEHAGGTLHTPPPEADGGLGTATLVDKIDLGLNIARFRFDLAATGVASIPSWTAGQYVVLDFNPELGQGYSHMRDDDPASLNDDLRRTFTVSSTPNSSSFEITIRNVGRCTGYLFRANVRAGLEFPVIAFGGDFMVPEIMKTSEDEGGSASVDMVGFVVGGVGVTPLIAQMPGLRRQGRGVRVWWSVRAREMTFVDKTIQCWVRAETQKKGDAQSNTATNILDLRLFVSGMDGDSVTAAEQSSSELESLGVHVTRRRLAPEDLAGHRIKDITEFYLCAGQSLTAEATQWLASEQKTVVTESFNF